MENRDWVPVFGGNGLPPFVIRSNQEGAIFGSQSAPLSLINETEKEGLIFPSRDLLVPRECSSANGVIAVIFHRIVAMIIFAVSAANLRISRKPT